MKYIEIKHSLTKTHPLLTSETSNILKAFTIINTSEQDSSTHTDIEQYVQNKINII